MDDADGHQIVGVPGVVCNGRTLGHMRSQPVVTQLERREDGSVFVRVDDSLNLAAWIEIVIPPPIKLGVDGN
jgi:hypothetical protein